MCVVCVIEDLILACVRDESEPVPATMIMVAIAVKFPVLNPDWFNAALTVAVESGKIAIDENFAVSYLNPELN